MDLASAIGLVDAIHAHVGLGECDDDQLAAWTDQSVKSSSFRLQIATARMFGVIDASINGERPPTEAASGSSVAQLDLG
jgi:hypothetical protein